MSVNGKDIRSVECEMTEEKDFARVIAAVAGMVAGNDPPKIGAWENDPDPFVGDDAVLPAPPANIDASVLASVVAAAPATVATAFPDANVLRLRDEFNQFVNLVRERTTDAEWTSFVQLLIGTGVAPTLGGQAVGDPNPGGGWWESWWSEKVEPRTEMTLPAEISNRGLVAKCLFYWAKKLIVANVAVGEGVVFGLWDGLVSDVEGVGAVLRMPVKLIETIRDPWGAAAEIYHSFLAIKELGWEGCKQQIIGLFNKFLTEQQERLEEVLGDQCKDPVYFASYMGGYLAGYVGEQVVAAMITGGAIKAGAVGRV